MLFTRPVRRAVTLVLHIRSLNHVTQQPHRLYPPPLPLLLPGGALLFAYTLGYVAPLLGAALFTGALQRILAMRQWSAWVTPASGVLLLTGGTYALLSRVFPA